MKTVKNRKRAALGIAGAIALSAMPQAAFADEGGISFWLPGNFGSLAAVPGTPGWSWATVYYHTEVSSAAGARFPRGGRIDLGIGGQGDLAIFGPTYTFAVPGLGAVGSVSLLGFGGRNNASVAASLTGPLGNTINLSRSEALTDIGDVIPQVTLKWNKGVNNIMVYATGDVPVGAYDPVRLANIGIGHGAMDFGGGYTYFDPHSGNEFSGVVGFTYNFKNPDTQYQSGVDFHFDWGASHFFTPNVQLGLVGYVMQQISDDTGPGATLGASARALPASDRRSASCSRWATCKAISTSRATRSSQPRTVPKAGTPGSPSRSRRRHPRRPRRSRSCASISGGERRA